MSVKWTDCTSYSQGERGAIPPQSWSTNIGGVRIVVTRHRDFLPHVWLLLVVHPLSTARRTLDATDIDKAKIEAIERVTVRVRKLADAFSQMDDACCPDQWRPIMDIGLPSSGEWVMVVQVTPTGRYIVKAQYVQAYDYTAGMDTEMWLSESGSQYTTLTHWRPLPALPN